MFFRSNRKRLEDRRQEVIRKVHEHQLQIEEMVQRAKACGEHPDDTSVTDWRGRLAAIEQEAVNQSISIDGLDALITDAQYQSQLSAYICPRREVADEGSLCLDEIEEWNVPKSVVAKLRATLGIKIAQAAEDVDSARSALRALFEERDSWAGYTAEYEETMDRYAKLLVIGVALGLPAAMAAVQFPITFAAGLLFAGLAGSFASVLAKMPGLDVALSGELNAYLRKQVLIRTAVGASASLVGCALLGWGVVSISIQGQTFSEIVNVCTARPLACGSLRMLILVAIPFLFGFSERALATLETKVFGK